MLYLVQEIDREASISNLVVKKKQFKIEIWLLYAQKMSTYVKCRFKIVKKMV